MCQMDAFVFYISQTISAVSTEPASVKVSVKGLELPPAICSEKLLKTEYQWKQYHIQSNGLINDTNQITVGLVQ